MQKALMNWLHVVMLVLVRTQAQGQCGRNVVQMVTRDSSPCRLRFDAAAVDANSARMRHTIASGRAAGDAKYQQALQREKSIVEAGVAVRLRTPEYHHVLSITPLPSIQDFVLRGLKYQHQATEIGNAVTLEYGLHRNLSGDLLLHLDIPVTEACTTSPRCNESDPYRTHDGSCTNLKHPNWGRAREPLTRLLLPVYDDGIYSPRKSVDGSDLPSARKLSTLLIQDKDIPDKLNSLFIMQWGEVIAIDVSLSADQRGVDALGIMCCTQDGQHLDASLTSQGCFRVDIPDDDSFFHKYKRTCMSVVRSNVSFSPDCSLSAAEQISNSTMVIDLSHVYASSKAEADGLRTFDGGRLKVQVNNGRSYLPQSGDAREFCNVLSANDTCFKSGQDYVKILDLLPLDSGYNYGYNDEIRINTLNSFTAASFRSFHSLIQGTFKLVDSNRCPVKDFLLSSEKNRPSFLLEDNNFDQIILGLSTQPSQAQDEYSTTEVTNKLFWTDDPWGQDLAAFDLLRGRDHGLPSYNDFRVLCGLRRAVDWADFEDVIYGKYVNDMSTLYTHPDDVDLFVGGLLENLVPGALMGPTFQCIAGEQFYRFKYGDRFFYEFQDSYHGFNTAQLQEIRKATLSRLICDNGDSIKSMQRSGFKLVSDENPVVLCDDNVLIPRVDLTKWKE